MTNSKGSPAYSDPVQSCPNKPGSLSVQVLTKGTSAPIADVRVKVEQSRDLAYTNAEGSTFFNKIDPGSYDVTLKLDSYLQDRYELSEPEKKVRVSGGASASLTFMLEHKTCWVSVVVEDDEHNPINDATVKVFYPDDGSETEIDLSQQTPEDDGSYLLQGIKETDNVELSLVNIADDEWHSR